MKKRNVVLVLVFLVPAFAAGWAEESTLPPGANRALIEDNLLIGLSSDNNGLQRSCALMLGYIKSDRAVIPLMSVLKQGENPALKIAAAWALCNIGDPRGTFAVRREVEYSDCCKTRLACAWYYENMVKSGTFVFVESEGNVIAELRK